MNSSRQPLKQKTITALVPNVLGFSPGQRVRIELWEKYLKEAGWRIEYFPFEDDALHQVLYKPGKSLSKIYRLNQCYRRRMQLLKREAFGEIIFIFREACLIGPAFVERALARMGIPIVYDIDDPVFLPYRSPTNGWASLLKFSGKTHSLFRLSTRIIAINRLIGDYARRYNPNVTVIPNCIDTDKYYPRKNTNDPQNGVCLVWIGSQSTMQNLAEIAGPLRKLQREVPSRLLIIGAGDPDLDGIEAEVRQWSAETEVSDLQEGDIGLLPLNDLAWNNWKFFFKAIQYMACGIPVVARRMGSNSEVIVDGVNGFLVESMDEWYERLKLLATNSELRSKMGEAARQTVVENYSLKTHMPRLVAVFEELRVGN